MGEPFRDRIDVDYHISLYEYGIVRSPVTDKVRYYNFRTKKTETTQITFDEVKECLQNIEEGYFDYIVSDRKTELSGLDNEHLTLTIFSVNQYNGYFELF